MLDLHTHILPGMDDGSRSVEQSIEMLAAQAAQGVDVVVLTSHFYPDREDPERFVKRRRAAVENLNNALAEHVGMPKLLPGAEVAFFDGISRVENIEQLCIGDTGAMLVEMPFCQWNRRVLNEIAELNHFRGIQPIIAHIERYAGYQPAGLVEELCEGGVWIQMNASHLLRWQTGGRALKMLRRGMVHFIASDCHNMSSRPPCLGQAMEKVNKRLGQEALDFLKRQEEMLLGGMR
nr:capsular polysaccharide biosynthesis protein [Clostridia bacterium]